MKILVLIMSTFLATPLYAAPSSEVSYIINSIIMLLCAALVMWMAAGFCMLEAGLVRQKSTGVICLKNIIIYSFACICFYLVGYNLMFTDVSGWIGSFQLFANIGDSELMAAITGSSDNPSGLLGDGYSGIAFIFFQMTFVAAAASVISGTVAERVKLWSFFIFVIILTAFIYPIQGSWTWGGGWLSKMGFSDFAGSSVVHSVGGWAALSGAYFLGPRFDKYDATTGQIKNYFPSSVPLVTLGVFILWFGWLGFNGGSLLTMSGVAEASKLSLIFINTNVAACAGAVMALILGQTLYKRINILLVLNGALAGLVSITAWPDAGQPLLALIIGAIGSSLATITPPILDKLRIDDVVGAIPVHLVAGIWGTLAVGIWGPASFSVQVTGIIAIGLFTFGTSSLVWFILKRTIGIRVSEDKEDLGQDLLELGLESDPDTFPVGNIG